MAAADPSLEVFPAHEFVANPSHWLLEGIADDASDCYVIREGSSIDHLGEGGAYCVRNDDGTLRLSSVALPEDEEHVRRLLSDRVILQAPEIARSERLITEVLRMLPLCSRMVMHAYVLPPAFVEALLRSEAFRMWAIKPKAGFVLFAAPGAIAGFLRVLDLLRATIHAARKKAGCTTLDIVQVVACRQTGSSNFHSKLLTLCGDQRRFVAEFVTSGNPGACGYAIAGDLGEPPGESVSTETARVTVAPANSLQGQSILNLHNVHIAGLIASGRLVANTLANFTQKADLDFLRDNALAFKLRLSKRGTANYTSLQLAPPPVPRATNPLPTLVFSPRVNIRSLVASTNRSLDVTSKSATGDSAGTAVCHCGS
ncbi:hypothetical protein ACM66B_001390 [Microbotryomycetes sp. NB124-2]